MGIFFPFILITGSYAFGKCHQIQPSISAYYYTNVHEFFVGTLCCISLFLVCYKGLALIDNMASGAAGFFGFCVALFPTSNGCYDCQGPVRAFLAFDCSVIHYVSAFLLFCILSFISLCIFTKTDPDKKEKPTPEKLKRNKVYMACGAIMVLCIVTMFIHYIINNVMNKRDDNPNDKTIFVCETIALIAFGFSWLTKGGTVFADKHKTKSNANESV